MPVSLSRRSFLGLAGAGAYAQLPVGQKSRFAVLYDVSPAMDAVTVVAGDAAVDVTVEHK
jgi:hypothetical protein